MDTEVELSRLLTTAVAATPGVTAVYASGSPIRAVLRVAAEVFGREDEPAKVTVAREDDGAVVVGVTIGVTDGAPVPTTMRLVGDAVRAVLLERDGAATITGIDVRVCRIEEGATAAR
ncbi:hypothetical protein ITJ57_02155 [Plantibacter sp. VKM Ac-2880]|uniref:hypothetical protein n=1 Tax=Plantibacter sp. VKM Ac-2880 TaxID=2783827 RepID=UPI0018902AC0|nr:hypothetical protein [Plantibacter sp. VKM Ac-2880]MBF4567556.1 hypothetical protein [Plantibacter sp. VKM Ac-2880]